MRPDLKTAVSYYLLSAGKGDAAAAYRLGRLYEEGYNWKDQTDGTFESLCHADNWPLVIDKDYDRALGWYLKSALSGSADAGKSLVRTRQLPSLLPAGSPPAMRSLLS